jgi:hypothetical protein
MALKEATKIPTIDVVLVTFKRGADATLEEFAVKTASKVGVVPQVETQDAVKLIKSGVLLAQKGKKVTVTGNIITLTDNVFTPEIVQFIQGGELVKVEGAVTQYTPPAVGTEYTVEPFEVCLYSAVYGTGGTILKYEKTTYPNCQGDPIEINSEDNVFRVQEMIINSYPEQGNAPYVIDYVTVLPTITQ